MDENNIAICVANVEQNSSYAPMAEEEAKGHHPPYDILVHSIRNRAADIDGISAKAAIDGLVHAGILGDDSAKWVKSIKYTQEKGKEEKTIIDIIGLVGITAE